MRRRAALLLPAAALLSACGGGEPTAAPTVTVEATVETTVTAEPEPAETVTVRATETVTEQAEAFPEGGDVPAGVQDELFLAGLSIGWNGSSADDKVVICDGIDSFGVDLAVALAEEGWNQESPEIPFDTEAAKQFYLEQCAAL